MKVTYTSKPASRCPNFKKKDLILICLVLVWFIFFMYSFKTSGSKHTVAATLVAETLVAAAQDPELAERLRSHQFISGSTKYILLWTSRDTAPFYYLGSGRSSFEKNKCTFTNCYVTSNRELFGGDITKFDAVVFNGRDLRQEKKYNLPQQRSAHQKYIYVNLEAAIGQTICQTWYEGFYNWTCTYRLDSDIVYSYIDIKDINGVSIGPRIDMDWIENMREIDKEFENKLKMKNKAVAWFVSHCITDNSREDYVKLLYEALEPHGLELDIYGACGTFVCPRSEKKLCDAILSRDYYFYLAFENSFAEDYVTEKLLTALNNNAVPIVYGGANYSRFVPPGSYINALDHKPEALAAIIMDIIANKTKYYDFFRWKNHYSYSSAESVEDVCKVCEALNDEERMEQSTYMEMRKWWNAKWEERCEWEEYKTHF